MNSSIAMLFTEDGRQSSPSDWEMVDRLEELFPDHVRQIQVAESNLKADHFLVAMCNDVASCPRLSEAEKRQLLSWIWGLRNSWMATPVQVTQGEIERRAKQAAEMLRQR